MKFNGQINVGYKETVKNAGGAIWFMALIIGACVLADSIYMYPN